MKIETKYDIGQKLFYVDIWDGQYRVQFDVIKRINFGGKNHEKYEIGNIQTRAESELYSNFDEAREIALLSQKEFNERALKLISEYKAPVGY